MGTRTIARIAGISVIFMASLALLFSCQSPLKEETREEGSQSLCIRLTTAASASRNIGPAAGSLAALITSYDIEVFKSQDESSPFAKKTGILPSTPSAEFSLAAGDYWIAATGWKGEGTDKAKVAQTASRAKVSLSGAGPHGASLVLAPISAYDWKGEAYTGSVRISISWPSAPGLSLSYSGKWWQPQSYNPAVDGVQTVNLNTQADCKTEFIANKGKFLLGLSENSYVTASITTEGGMTTATFTKSGMFGKNIFRYNLVNAANLPVYNGMEQLDFAVGLETAYVKTLTAEDLDLGPAGGTIFYDKGSYSDGWRYLEAAPNDHINGDTVVAWSNVTSGFANGATALPREIGKGMGNSEAIVKQTGHTASAAQLCLDYSVTWKGVTYDDWFLPSQDELYELYKAAYSVTTTNSNKTYHSSTEIASSSSNAFCIDWPNKTSGFYGKDCERNVWPIRRF